MRRERVPGHGHAGPLPRWERLAILIIIVALAALITGIALA
jgi:hypothetical protein